MSYIGNQLVEKWLRPEQVPTRTCSGCGIGIVENIVINALEEMDLTPEQVVFLMGVGCSSRQVYSTFRGDNIDANHGRPVPIATALKLVKPNLKYLVFAGDGDVSAIGNNHVIHAARRNVDINVFMLNNLNYASTSGQHSPLTPKGLVTQTTPYGNEEPPYEIGSVLAAAGATFVARHTILQPRQAIKSVQQAINNKGFSFVEFLMPCPTYTGRYALGSGNPLANLHWIEKNVEDPSSPFYRQTGILLDSSNSRPEFSALKREIIRLAQGDSKTEQSFAFIQS